MRLRIPSLFARWLGRDRLGRAARRLGCEWLEPRQMLTGSGRITGVVFYDDDGDGRQDANEPGLSGWTVFLDDNDNGLRDAGEAATTSDGVGNFFFTGVAPGGHFVREVELPGWGRTVPYAPGYAVDIVADQTFSGLLFGNQIVDSSLYATVSGFVWNDQNANGSRGPSEPGLTGWQVYLDSNNNAQLDSWETSTHTNAAGRYVFDRLPPVPITVREVIQPGWQQTFPASGAHTVGLSLGQTIDPLNFGNALTSPGKLTGEKWRDLNHNGERDDGEPALSNWEFYLDENHNGQWDSPEPTTITNAQGIFEFLGIAPGNYDVGEVLPTGWTQTFPGASGGFAVAGGYDLVDLPRITNSQLVTGTIAVGDVDGDADLDLVSATMTAISVLYNDGAGQFATETTLPLTDGGIATGSLILKDLDGDGRLDIVVGGQQATTGPTNRLYVYFGRLGGYGGTPFSVPSSLVPDLLAAGDFNADGLLDIAAGTRNSRSLALFYGDPRGALAETSTPSLAVTSGLDLGDLVAADFDLDGRADLAAIGVNSLAMGPNTTSLFQAWQSLANGEFASTSPLNFPGALRDLFVADLRGDEVPEILALAETAGPTGIVTKVQELSLGPWQASLGSAWTVHAGSGLETTRTQALDAADFDGDGIQDLVVLDSTKPAVWFLQGRHTGAWDSPRAVPLGAAPIAVAAALLNGDSAPDLALLNSASSNLSILLNDGRGSFPGVDRLDSQQSLDDVSAIDLDGDGDLDLAGFDFVNGRLSISFNRGAGKFDSPRTFALEPGLAAALFGHIDSDNVLDLVTISNRKNVGGDDVFRVTTRLDLNTAHWLALPSAAAKLDFPGWATAGTLSDLNGDSKLDALVTFGRSALDPSLQRQSLLGEGNGAFHTFANTVLQPQFTGTNLLADLDGDHDLDRVTVHTATNQVNLQWNLGGGAFSEPTVLATDQEPRFAAIADFDGDQDLDLVVANALSGTLSVWRNNGHGLFPNSFTLNVGGHPASLAAVDFDVDGFADLAVVDDVAGTVRVLRATGSGAFADRGTTAVGAGASGIVTGDWNGDQRVDLATVDSLADTITLLYQSSGLNFTSRALSAGDAPRDLVAGYLNEDGLLDLYFTRDVNDAPEQFELLNDGQGAFGSPNDFALDRTTRDSTLGDVTGDGWLDLVTVDDFSRTLLVFPGVGNGDFLAPATTTLNARPHFVRAADLDGDVDLDLSIGWLDRAGIGVLRNDGSGTFSPLPDYVLGAPPRPFWTGDLDDDGRTDYVAPNPTGGFYDFARGLGNGAFAPPVSLVGDQPGSLAVGDLNGDGNLDLLGTFLGEDFAIFWNQTRPDDQYHITVLPGQSADGASFGNYRPIPAWQNSHSNLDVDNDTFIAPMDALLVINRLNEGGGGLLPQVNDGQRPPPYYDTSGDDYLTPIDALLVINYLNLHPNQEGGEGEGDAPVTMRPSTGLLDASVLRIPSSGPGPWTNGWVDDVEFAPTPAVPISVGNSAGNTSSSPPVSPQVLPTCSGSTSATSSQLHNSARSLSTASRQLWLAALQRVLDELDG